MSKVEKTIEINELLRVYGGLLTPKQFAVLTNRYGRDLSLGEIAELDDISRQGVLKFEKAALKQLYKFEKTLGVLKRNEKIKAVLSSFITDENARSAMVDLLI